MHAALDTSVKPVIFSHSSCRHVADHPRNIPDDVLVRLKTNGGVAMITFVPDFVSNRVARWDAALRDAMAAAGANHADMEERKTFGASWVVDNPKPAATLDDVVAHLEHAREVVGIDHMGIGGDYDGVQSLPEGLEDVSTYPNLFGALLDKGWSEDDCTKLAGANILRVLRDADA